MSLDETVREWLAIQPADQPLDIDGESAYLTASLDGAEIGVVLFRSYTSEQLQESLRFAFESALLFDAGLGRTADGQNLVLSRWIPGARSWMDVAGPLEDLLNQADYWRQALVSSERGRTVAENVTATSNRDEQRIRRLITGGYHGRSNRQT